MKRLLLQKAKSFKRQDSPANIHILWTTTKGKYLW